MYEIIVSTLALAISAVTAWLTLFRRGQLRMTKPTVMAFAHDGGKPKIFIRALLYCTADRGRFVETMYANLRQGDTNATFAFWGYGESTQLVRGSGLFVGREGVSLYHHFVSLKDNFVEFKPGKYTVDIFATTVGNPTPHKLTEFGIDLSGESAELLNNQNGATMFNWNPQSGGYEPENQLRVSPGLFLPSNVIKGQG
jgi:hypothetical protein